MRTDHSIASIPFGDGVKIESATLLEVTAKAPEHREVRGAIWAENRLAAGLPAALTARKLHLRSTLRGVTQGERTASTAVEGMADHSLRLG